MLCHLLLCRYGPNFNGVGDQLLIDLGGVDHDPLTDFDIGFLDRLFAPRVGCLCIEADLDCFPCCCFDRD